MSKELQPKDLNERKWATAIHASAFAGMLFPLALALGPLLIWMLTKHGSDYLDKQGKKAINFQLTILILVFICGLVGALIKPVLALAVMTVIGGLVFAIMAAVMVYREGNFNYPFSLNFIK